jgi:hypothetical protein
VKLSAPPDLPAALRARFDLVADLGEIDAGGSEDVASTMARVVTISDFVRGVLQRFPRELVARVADRAPITSETLASSFDLANRTEEASMAELRRVRNIELARIAERDLAGFADLDTTLAELSLLAEGLIAAAASFAAAEVAKRRRAPRDAAGKPLPLLVLAMGMLDFGRAFMGWVSLTGATRVGANYASAHPTANWGSASDPDRQRYLAMIATDLSTTNCPLGSTAMPTFSPDTQVGSTATVTLTCSFHFITPAVISILGSTMPMSATTAYPIRTGEYAPPAPTPQPEPPAPVGAPDGGDGSGDGEASGGNGGGQPERPELSEASAAALRRAREQGGGRRRKKHGRNR